MNKDQKLEFFKENIEDLYQEQINDTGLDTIKLVGLTQQDKDASQDALNNIIREATTSIVKNVMKSEGSPLEALRQGVRLDMKSSITDKLFKLPVGALLAIGISSVIDNLKEQIHNSVELSVLGTLQNYFEGEGNAELAQQMGELFKSKLSDVDSNYEVASPDKDSPANKIVEEYSNSKQSRKDDDDLDFLEHLRKN